MTEREPPLIADSPALIELVEHLRSAGRFAFDTEFVSEETYEPVLCLAQVATTDRIAAIDTMAIRDLGPLWDVLNDPAVEVVMHAAGEDLRIMLQRAGRLPARVVDVQVAAGLVGGSYPLSLGNLVRSELGITVAGGETRTDWRRRPLSPAQTAYALDDVRYLLEIADRINDRLRDANRLDWAEDEYRSRLEAVAARSEDEDRWRRIPGVNGLNRRGMEAARRLEAWRHAEARRANRPVRQMLRDDLLVGIAKRLPATRKDLEALRDVQRSPIMSRVREVLEVIAEAQLVPEAELPRHGPRYDEGPGLPMVVSLLQAALGRCCVERRVAASLVGSSSDLKELVRWHAAGYPATWRPALSEGWRGTVCGHALIDVLTGRCALRIDDPTADVPVGLIDTPTTGDRPA